MVTEITLAKNIHPSYMNIKWWIINGLSTSARLTVLTAWNQINSPNINIYDDKYIQPVNKW